MRKSIPMIDSTKTPARRPRASSQTHRNEFPAGYSLASCSPAELASAFPTNLILQQSRLSVEQISADGSCLTSLLSQKGPQSTSKPVETRVPRKEMTSRNVDLPLALEPIRISNGLIDCSTERRQRYSRASIRRNISPSKYQCAIHCPFDGNGEEGRK